LLQGIPPHLCSRTLLIKGHQPLVGGLAHLLAEEAQDAWPGNETMDGLGYFQSRLYLL